MVKKKTSKKKKLPKSATVKRTGRYARVPFKACGRKLKKPRGGERSYAAAKRRQACGTSTSGHGKIIHRSLAPAQVKAFKKDGFVMMHVGDRRRKVTKCNVQKRQGGGYYIGYYKRSDTGKYAMRNFCSDRKRAASHKSPGPFRRNVGDL